MNGSLRRARMLMLILVGVVGMLIGPAPVALAGPSEATPEEAAPRKAAPQEKSAPKKAAPKNAAPRGPSRVILAAGVPVQLQVKNDLSSQTARAGDAVAFVVSAPVQVGGIRIIASGAEARGTVAYSAPATPSRHGDLLVSVDSAQAVDGSWVPLRATARLVDSADTILPASVVTFGGSRSSTGRDAVLPASRRLECWIDETRAFVVTPPERPGTQAAVVSEGETTPRTEARCTLVHLPLGTTVRVHPVREISAKRVKAGDRVDFAVTTAVEAGGNVVIREGALARGLVMWARPLGVAGTRSELVVRVDQVDAQDGSKVALAPSSPSRGTEGEPVSTMAAGPLAALVTSEHEAVLGVDRAFDLVLCEERLFAVGAGGRKTSGPQVRALVLPSGAVPVALPIAAARPPVLEAFQVGLEVGPSGDPRGVSDTFSKASRLLAWCSLEPAPQERRLEVAWFRDGAHSASTGPVVVRAGEGRMWTALDGGSGGFVAAGRWVVVLSWRGQVLDVQSFSVRP